MTTFNTTYKEQLQRAKEQGLNIVALSVAYEVSCKFDGWIYLDDDTFEDICEFVRDIYLEYWFEVAEIVQLIFNIITYNSYEDEPYKVLEEWIRNIIINNLKQQFN